jgi:hypothetical protein
MEQILLDGKPLAKGIVPADLTGKHTLDIRMANRPFREKEINLVSNHFSLPTPLAQKEGSLLKWKTVEQAKGNHIYRNGKFAEHTTATQYEVPDEVYAEYKVSAKDEKGYESFTSEPIVFTKNEMTIEMETIAAPSPLPYTNYSGKGFVEITQEHNKALEIKVNLDVAGEYLIDVRYSNGSGPWNTDNKCALRSLSVNGAYSGVLVLPQRGQDEWSDWGFSNSRRVKLNAGDNLIRISFEGWNHNMNGEVNTAMLDYLQVIRVE